MNPREQLNTYLEALERRLRLGTMLRGAAVLLAAALTATVGLVLIINQLAFSRGSLLGARGALLLALGVSAALGLAIPLWRLDRRNAAGKAESAFPKFQQRLITFAERDPQGREPFLELLAADTMPTASESEAVHLVPRNALLASMGIGAASLGVLIWLVLAGPGYLGYGAALLWAGPSEGVSPLYDIRVSPGDVTVRRNADELITAEPIGLQTDRVRLYARSESASKWERLNMQPQPGGSAFQFTFAGLPESVEYYVEAGPLRSRHFNIRVADLPAIKQIRVTYHYPGWTGLQNAVEERGGDLRAIEGTDASLEILTDRPLRDGILVVDDQQIRLTGGKENRYDANIRIEKDGAYHVATLEQGQPVRLSEDYFIEASKANPPEVAIARPGRDYQASPIEEVTVSARAADEFGLHDFQLHYSVNGGAEQSVNLLKGKSEKSADGSTVLHLEDFKVVPGDIVSVYATAKDARAESRTDMFFIQAEPFEREFSQSQQAGGGGGGGRGGDQSEISQREKEIIAATWKQLGDKGATPEKAAENAKFLSGVQAKLREQALSLAGRLESRDLTQQNAEFSGFQQDMNAAAAAMSPASEKLQQRKWNDAIPNEQKALQYLLRAEATFRQIEVAFGNSGGGAGGSAGRDLASLFDLELDTQKNQYETAQTASSGNQRDEAIDEALRKLDELARRQADLADQQRNSSEAMQQRWQQEMLRRETEELQRQVEQLSRNSQQGSGTSSNQSSGSSSSSSGSQSGSDSRARQALDRLRQATDDMRRAASQGQSEADARRAADRLREAQGLLNGMQRQAASGRLDSMAGEADRLAKEEQEQADRMQRAFGRDDSSGFEQRYPDEAQIQERAKLAGDRLRLADELARLEKEMRDAESGLAASDRPAASKLRDALGQLDESDLETRIQRSADRLRTGINPYRNSGEAEIATGLQRLSDQIRQAQQALGSGQQHGSESAINQVERLRSRLESLDRGFNPGNALGGRQGRTNLGARTGAPGDRTGAPGLGTTIDNGFYGNNRDGYRGGRNNWSIDTGNNSTAGPRTTAPANTTTAGTDPERTYEQGMNDLNQLRQAVETDPETLRQVQELIREMQRLDPKRFPGNPELVEQLHTQVLNDVDKLELQLRRKVDDQESGQVRSGDSLPVPPGYQEAVAEYFRRLSKRP
ncbi:MAG TPA: hypothetical protein VJO53_06925 [Candidatus Acidoferrales bacterium]|nr:hypothetical protein [Candidatus Acidoferrales bacterium]